MQMNPYLSFRGDCEAAFKLYERCLGAQVRGAFRYSGSPMANDVPTDWQDKIMHGTLMIGEQLLMGGDVPPERYEAPRGFSLSLQIQSIDDADRIFRELGSEGTVLVPLEKTFWAARFGMVVDRFGIPWMINCEESEPAAR
jgi:PhnB protein